MRRFGLLLATLLCLAWGLAWADDFTLPGLEADSAAYAHTLTSRFPAGGTPQARKAAEQAAAAAVRKQDWAAAAAAWETRIGQGDATAAQWLSLAETQMRRTPPEANRALQAAWQNYSSVEAGAPEVPSLLLMSDALKVLNRPAQAIQALEAAAERAPDNKAIVQKLDEARKDTGILVRRVTPEPEAEPPRVCIDFTVAPARRDDFHAEDWVRLDPIVQGAAVTREGDQICVSGLPSGATTRITLRAGMPGEAGLSLVKDISVAVAMANRRSRIDFDTRMFLLPRGQTPSIGLSTINLSSVNLTLARLTERNVVAFVRSAKLGQPVDSWDADRIGKQSGRIVWQGTADIPKWEPNRAAHTTLPLPEALAASGPGLYALIARAGDGTPNAPTGVQMILRTDFAPTIWRGTDGLTVQVRGYSDVKPRQGVTLRLLAENNDILGETTTDADGFGRFAAPLLHGEGPVAPRAVEVLGGEDYTMLDLASAAFDLSDRGVAGLPHPGPLDAYVWLDRGIFRPGETAQVMALLRDNAGRPADIPVHVVIKRPNGQVFLDTTPARLAEASVHLPVKLSTGAPAGTWTIEVKADPVLPPIGRAQFRVDAFVPDRMAVEFGAGTGPIIPGRPYSLPVTARFLYGAPAAGLTGQGQMRLVIDPAPFPALAGYRIGLVNEAYAPDARDLTLPDTDEQGHSALGISLSRAPDVTHALKASITAGVNDPSGHASLASTEIPVRPAGNLIGIKPAFADEAVDAGTEAAFDIAAVNADGARTPLKAKLRLVRERPGWRLVMRGSLARYETIWRDEPLETQPIDIPAGSPFHFARKLDFGRYRIEVLEDGGMAATSVRFRAGWVSSDDPDVPDQVDVSADRKAYAPGETARIHIAPPFAGEATLLVLSDRVRCRPRLSRWHAQDETLRLPRCGIAAALAAPARKWWAFDYGTALRDQAAIAQLLKESDLPGDRLTKLLALMPGPDLAADSLSTQEQAWAAAAGVVLGRNTPPARVALNGANLLPAPVVSVALTGLTTARNLGDRPIWRAASVPGVPATALPAARSQMRITRQFKTLDGQPLDLDHLKQNTVFVLVLEGKAEDGQPHRAMIQHGLPAGWEIAGRLSGGDVPGMAWLGKLSEPEAQPAADDRYAAVVPLTPEEPDFRLAVRVRAVTPGIYELPGAEVADMYRPGVFARQAAGRITVAGAE